MNRNGKAPHGAGDTLDAIGAPSEPSGTPAATLGMVSQVVGAPSEAAGMPSGAAGMPQQLVGMTSEAAGTPSEAAGTPSDAAGTPSGRRVASFDANASIARRLAAAQAQAHASYMRHLGVARVALRGERAAAQQLGLAGKRQTRQADWLLQAQQFYANALADAAILRALAGYKLSAAQLEEGQRQVAAVAGGAVARQASTGAAREATQARDAALEALNRWMRDFLAIARIALAGQPRRLEQLGQRAAA